jgi:putative nucleotidyltransferase with HDIG domain
LNIDEVCMEASSMSAPSADENRTPTVLIVDDEAGPRDALKIILRPFFNIQSAENATMALNILNTQPIDLIALDQKLPDRQGMDLLQDIKHHHADIEVIIITGYGSVKSAMEGIRHGAAGYLLKPFNVTELITLVNQTLEKKRRLDFIRSVFRSTPELWGSEQEASSAWQSLKTGYYALGPHTHGGAVDSQGGSEILPLLSDILEAKNKQLLHHSSRVSFYATLMGARINLTSDAQQSLTMGAFLHDIGKTHPASDGFSEGRSPFSEATASRKEHPHVGARLIRSLGLPAEVTQIVSYHHERWDGRGYPHGLQGEGIPLLARIVSIAQMFDHLTAEVPGQSPLPIDEAIHRISLESHTHFDPTLASIFIEVLNKCKASLPPMAVTPVTALRGTPDFPTTRITH